MCYFVCHLKLVYLYLTAENDLLFRYYHCIQRLLCLQRNKVKVEIEANPKSIASDPYSCAIKTKHDYFVGWKTVGHIPREISRYVYFFIKQEGGKVNGRLNSLKYKAFPIPSGGLEVPLSLKFKCDEKWVLDAMEEFVDNFYSYDFAGNLVNDEDEDDESVDFVKVII